MQIVITQNIRNKTKYNRKQLYILLTKQYSFLFLTDQNTVYCLQMYVVQQPSL